MGRGYQLPSSPRDIVQHVFIQEDANVFIQKDTYVFIQKDTHVFIQKDAQVFIQKDTFFIQKDAEEVFSISTLLKSL